MREKLQQWWYDHQDDVDAAVVVTALATIVYSLFWVLNWIFVKFLSFTGLWYVLLLWIGIALGRVVQLWREDAFDFAKEENKTDVDSFL